MSNKILVLLLLIGSFLVAFYSLTDSIIPSRLICPQTKWDQVVDEVELFYNISMKYGTDKVTSHSYQHLYGIYLGPKRSNSLVILEIGLGCDMPYGPGRSLNLWREYLPASKIHILEYNAPCATRFINQTDRLYTGDQSDFELLSQIATGNKYDVIIDDGGHTRKQQIHSLIGLWPALKPKGVYIIEDMFTTLMENSHFIDLNISTVKVMEYFIYKMNKKTIHIDQYQTQLDQIFSRLLSVNCFSEACVLVKQ